VKRGFVVSKDEKIDVVNATLKGGIGAALATKSLIIECTDIYSTIELGICVAGAVGLAVLLFLQSFKFPCNCSTDGKSNLTSRKSS